MTRRPDFIGIGAGKAGSSWLWSQLRQHPGLFLPDVKELNYFNEESFEDPSIRNPRSDRPLEWYLAFFDGATEAQRCGEISPAYLWSQSAPSRIRALGDVQLMALIRDPIERSLSHFNYRLQTGVGDPRLDFTETVREHPSILTQSLYSQHLRRYFDIFPRSAILVGRHDDLRDRPAEFLREVLGFLGVEGLVPDDAGEVRNQTVAPRNPRLTRALMQGRLFMKRAGLDGAAQRISRSPIGAVLRRAHTSTRPADGAPIISAETEDELRAYFEDDIAATEELVNLDLSSWKTGSVR